MIAGTKSNEIQTQSETIEISAAQNAPWKHFIAGWKEWSINTSFLVSTMGNIADLLSVGDRVALTIMTGTPGTGAVSQLIGNAIVTNVKITATWGNLATGSFSFKGTGPLSTGSSS